MKTAKPTMMEKIQIEQQRAQQHRDRKNWFILIGFVAAIPLAIVLLFFTNLNEEDAFKFASTGGIAVGALSFFVFRGKKARCPNCRFDWEINERVSGNVLEWHECPECGMPLRRSALAKWLERSRS